YYIRDDNGVYYRYEGGTLVPNGQTPYACTAGNYGTIAQIPPDYTVVIRDLVAGTDFFVDEIRVRPNGTTSDVLIANSDWVLQSTDVSECDEAEITGASIYDYATGTTITGDALGRIAWDKDAQVVFTNKAASVDVQLKKVKEDGTTIISGSIFDLNKFRSSWTSIQTNIKPGEAATDTTPAVPNPVDLGELTIGRYQLTETKAPDGYIILTKHVYFEVYKDTDGSLKARLTDEAGTAVDSPTDMAAIDGPGTGDTPIYTVTIKNTPGAILPNTGGFGTLPYTLGGLMLVMASALMYGFRMRRRERRLN
ncbi:MAG: LPXTG cell wall anchor domain-containing protein, partial [Erysipelotrichaceae bacterium]|nr:LPXTG cell wall anchor domain-containing protein [Erysipelotrichaceae bacterium]